MTSSTKSACTEVLKQPLILKPYVNQKSIQIDFELSFILASHIKIQFSKFLFKLNFFFYFSHYVEEKSTFMFQVKYLCALTFVPVQKVVKLSVYFSIHNTL